MATDIFKELRDCGVAAVAKAFKIPFDDGIRLTLKCPACGAEKRDQRGNRLAVGIRDDDQGWLCHKCKAAGDAGSLASWVILGESYPTTVDEVKALREGCSAVGLCQTEDKRHIEPIPMVFKDKVLPTTPIKYPPLNQIETFWSSCSETFDDEIKSWLKDVRGINPNKIEDQRIVRVLPKDVIAPSWASFWVSSGYRLIFPLYDVNGCLRSLRGRRIFFPDKIPKDDYPKSNTPKGYQISGLVLADKGGVDMLRGVAFSKRTLISEGETDLLSALMPEWKNGVPAILGIANGTWNQDIANKIPDGTEVIIATDKDKTGNNYFKKVYDTLNERHKKGKLKVLKWNPKT